MSRFWGTAADLTDLINAMEKPGILLLEDLDAANGKNRQIISTATEVASSGADASPGSDKSKDATLAALRAESQSAGSSGGNTLLETLLQALDGVGAAQADPR
ncbi:hypothetical protein F5883DRAFT_525447 [Diaporthe sp. PMI_573]|nr:hypothetical protein F5883DRAFT_525447 [Diaporthaceae sp. PMI_573]